ncbi:MAG TPA: NAD(P)-dependent oxidoreductase [Ignavibacteria bacterium]|nr:NAD(P)-dependent oxidoreductase [Ignavibacteria bacterium]
MKSGKSTKSSKRPVGNTNVLFNWKIDSVLKQHLRESLRHLPEIKLIFPNDFKADKILKHTRNADIIVGWKTTIEMLKSAEKLKLYINPGTGIKYHIDNFREINRLRKVVLVNGHGHAYSTAQHAVAMLLTLMNRVIPHHNLMKDGIWNVSDNEDLYSSSVQLRNRKIGLLGYGAINKNVHKFLSGFENKFFILRQRWGDKIEEKFSDDFKKYNLAQLNQFLKDIDILIIAIPHTSKTENMIGEKELKLLGKNSLLVNVARGIIVNEKSLYDSLKKGITGGAALDVWYNYTPEKDKSGKEYPYKYPFHKLKNIILSPHRAASPFDEISRWDEVIENIKRLNAGREDYLNIVDLNAEY